MVEPEGGLGEPEDGLGEPEGGLVELGSGLVEPGGDRLSRGKRGMCSHEGHDERTCCCQN